MRVRNKEESTEGCIPTKQSPRAKDPSDLQKKDFYLGYFLT